MAKVFAPFPMTRTIGDLTFYMMDGVNYVRTKSSLTRKCVLKSPKFKQTRFYAGLMGQASKIGSVIYQALPKDWRQGWMYRAFTGEAMEILQDGKTVKETTRLMWERYVEAINEKGEDLNRRLQDSLSSVANFPKERRKKTDPRVERLKPYSNLLSKASKMASFVYNSLPLEKRKFAIYQACVGEAMRFLQAEETESKREFPIAKSPCTGTAIPRQTLLKSDAALTQASGNLEAMGSITHDPVKNPKKRNISPGKNRLFYIPPADSTPPKLFSRRRKHHSRLVSRLP
jgi:hypothetical protein